MLIETASTRVTRRQGVQGHVGMRHNWACRANFPVQGTIVGTKRAPQPTAYKGEAPVA